MKLEAVRFYQAIPMGQKLETYLTRLPGNPHEGLSLEWAKGLLKIEGKVLKKPIYVPSANIMYFIPEEKGAKPE